MYTNCKIINPINKHLFTFIMLHPMHCDSNYFNEFIDYFERIHKLKYLYNSIKFILPEAPQITIDYPNNKLYNVNSWYNYYTCYDGIDKIDNINIDDFQKQSERIAKIILNEANLLNKFEHIYLMGVSQGGSLIFNILNMLPRSLGGIFCIKSIYMNKYSKLIKNISTPIFIFSGKKDNIYSINLQKKVFKILKKRNFKIKWSIIDELDHFSVIDEEHLFIINNFINHLNMIK